MDSLRKGQSKGKGKRQQSNLALAKWMQTRVSTVADLDTGRRTAGDQVEVHMTASTVVPQRQGQGQGERKERRGYNGRCADEHPFWPEVVIGNIIDLSVSSFTESCVVNALWCSSGWQDGWILTLDAACHSLSSGLRQPGAEYMLLERCTDLRVSDRVS